MPVKYENGKKVHLPYPNEKNKNKKGKLTSSEGKKISKRITGRVSPVSGKTRANILDKALGIADKADVATSIAVPAKGLVSFGAKKAIAKMIGFGAIPGIITEAGKIKHAKAYAALKLGEGQEAVRRKVKGLTDILKKHPKRFDKIDKDEMDIASAQAILNPKNKPELDYGKLVTAGKLKLAEIFEAVKNQTNIKSVDVHGTNRALNKVLGKTKGKAGTKQYKKTIEKAREGTFNPEHTEALKRIHRKKKREK
jgi:hypothetical protein